MKKSTKVTISVVSGAVVLLGITGLILGLVLPKKARERSEDQKEELYQKGLKHLIDAEYNDATKIFAKAILKDYKDTPKKYNYSFNLQRYEQKAYSYENLINYGLNETGSVAIVDFDVKGGEAVAQKTITEQTEGKYVTETTSKDYYDFISWNLSFACYELESDSIRYFLEANYSDHAYKISYELDGADEITLPRYYYHSHGDVSIPNLTKTGYTFLGYESDLYDVPTKNFVIPNDTFGDITLTAKFEVKSYHVKFDASPVSITDEIDVTYGQDVTDLLPTPDRDFFTFECWTYNGEGIDPTSWDIDSDVTLVARYTPIEYKITYILNGATNPGLPENYNFLSEIHFPFIEKANACFIGWKVGSLDENPTFILSHDHGDKTIEASFVNATITDGVLMDISDHNVKNIVIPSFVTDISNDFFSKLDSLVNIYVDAKNEHFKVQNGLLIKDEHIAFAYPRVYAHYHGNVTLPNTITEIAEQAFKNTEITAITGSDLVSKINSEAFKNSSSLTEVNLSGVEYVGNSAFTGSKVSSDFFNANKTKINYIGESAFKDTLIDEVEILSNVKQIGDYAFAKLTGITSVSFYPNPACVIGDNLFDESNNLVTLNTDSKFFEKLMTSSFNGHSLETINLKGSTNIVKDICKDYTSLETLDLSTSTMTQIGEGAFKNDVNLKTVSLPSQLVRINASAFEGCSKLDTVNFNNSPSLFSIRESAFKGAAFTKLDFSKNTHLTIEDHAFTSNTELTEIKMYHGQIITRVADVFDLCHKISNITYYIPETTQDVVELPNFLFEHLNNVENITFEYLGSEAKEIKFGMYAFKDDSALVDVTMSNCFTTSIPKHCFDGCASFTNESGTFSNMVQYDEGAFFGCLNLNTIGFEGTTIIGDDAFAGCYSLCLNGPIVIPRIEGHINFGIGVFADITGVIKFDDYTESEVSALTSDATKKWWHFDEGYSGTFIYKT